MTMIEPSTRSDHNHCSELLPWYANETLEPEERQVVEAHLSCCPECQEQLALLDEMRHAVLDEGSLPISVPLRSADVIDRGPEKRSNWRTSSTWRLAATVMVALPLVWLLIQSAPNQRFETVTSEGQTAAVQYVLELELDPTLPQEEADTILRGLGTPVAAATSVGPSRVMVELTPRSLEELEAYAQDIAQHPGIESAKFVALQVPVR